MNRLRAMMMAVGLALAAGCSTAESTTEAERLIPREQWWEGKWRAISVDGQPLPATITVLTSRVRYDSLTVYFGAGPISSFHWYAELLGGSSPFVLGCGGLITIARQNDRIAIAGPNQLNNCPYTDLAGRTFIQSGTEMTHNWDGRAWVLRKEP